MGSNFELNELAEGIERRNMLVESDRLVKKWERTGLLEGLKDSPSNKAKSTMARLLENQAASLLNESTSTTDIMGFQNVAFPIVRRVFGGLIANELVSVQPMSLPSGLLFYLDYRYDSKKAGNKADNFSVGGSLFGDRNSDADAKGSGGLYNLGTSFSQREKVAADTAGDFATKLEDATEADFSYDPELSTTTVKKLTLVGAKARLAAIVDADSSVGGLKHVVPLAAGSTIASSTTDGDPVQFQGGAGAPAAERKTLVVYRRHTKVNGNDLVFIVGGGADGLPANYAAADAGAATAKLSYVANATLTAGKDGAVTLPEWESDLGSTPVPVIPEIDLKITSVPVVAAGRKLRAKWTPEVAQDLAAYQNLDAEVELTQVLSEAIALEIDREILADLLYNATGANYHWSRQPGDFVDKTTGAAVAATFTGTVREWYETLVETIIDVANTIHRKTLRGAANWVVVSPDVATILEASVLYKPVLSMDPKETMFTVGTEKAGSLNNRFTVYKDPYFPRNKVLVGYKGSSFLETGFVYAPYVPLIVTPTIYAPEDFTPRKGVMTRYAKKLVRSDFYGTVTVQKMNVI